MIVAFVPARGNSKSIPRKNLKLLGEKPLIVWSIETAFKAGIEKVVVSTEDPEIKEVALKYGAEVLDRPANLAGDKTSMLEVLQHEIPRITPKPDIVVLLQPTSPTRSKTHVQMAISLLVNNDKYDSLISVERVPEKYNPYAMILETSAGKRMLFRKLFGWKEKLIALFTGKKYVGPQLSGFPISQRMTRRQDLGLVWIPDGSIYAFRTDNLKSGSIYGRETLLLETEGRPNLNTEAEWKQLEEVLKEKNVKS